MGCHLGFYGETKLVTAKHSLATAIRTVRKARGLSQEAFSDVSSRTYMSTLERDLKSPDPAQADRAVRGHGSASADAVDAGLRRRRHAQGRRTAGAGAPGVRGRAERARRALARLNARKRSAQRRQARSR